MKTIYIVSKKGRLLAKESGNGSFPYYLEAAKDIALL